MFEPKSVAVVGASRNPQKLGHRLVKNLLDYSFPGAVYPINIEGGEVLGIRAYPRVSDVGQRVDLVLISVPNERVMSAVEDCARARVGAVVILSSGFGETGSMGKEVEDKIRGLARTSGMRVLGPNCMGIYNIHSNLNGTYFWEIPMVAGNISFLSQSGAYGGIMFRESAERGMGISKFVSMGNQIDIGYPELLDYLHKDEHTQVIALFIEEIKDGPAFLRTARRVAKDKPIVAIKAGRTEAGVRAALSHTGSLAGSAEIYRAVFRQAGIVWARDTEEFFDLCKVLSRYVRELPKDERVAIATISGGPCVIAGDTAEEEGLIVPPFSQALSDEVRRWIPPFGACKNPVDMTPQMSEDNFGPCVELLFRSPETSGVIGINVGLDTPKFSQAFIEARRRYSKPLVIFTASAPGIYDAFEKAGVPIFPTPERAVRAYSGLVRYAQLSRRPMELRDTGEPAEPLSALKEMGPILDEHQSKGVLRAYGIPTCKEAVVEDGDMALEAAKKLGYPLVAKVLSEEIRHKTEAGGIILNITDGEELKRAIEILKGRFPGARILIQEQVEEGLELIIGVKRDPTFSPVVAFGLGGIFTELFRDVSFRVAPLTPVDAHEMMKELKGYPLLTGFRGGRRIKEGVLEDILLKVSRLALANPRIKEMDINPLIATAERVVAVDALIILGGD